MPIPSPSQKVRRSFYVDRVIDEAIRSLSPRYGDLSTFVKKALLAELSSPENLGRLPQDLQSQILMPEN